MAHDLDQDCVMVCQLHGHMSHCVTHTAQTLTVQEQCLSPQFAVHLASNCLRQGLEALLE